MIRHSRVVVVEDGRGVRVRLRVPGPLDAERRRQAEVEAAPAGTQRPAPHAGASGSAGPSYMSSAIAPAGIWNGESGGGT